MAPRITIVLGGLLGFIWKGVLGGVAGLVCGYLLSLLIGGLFFAGRGGLVPVKAKQQAARQFLNDYGEIAVTAFPGLNQTARLQAVEDAIEKVFRRSMDDNPGPGDRALARDSIQRAGLALSAEARTPALREFWSKLVAAIELAMYP